MLSRWSQGICGDRMTGPILRILFVEDSNTSAEAVLFYLEEGFEQPYTIHRTLDLKSTEEALGDSRFDLLLLDLNLPDSHGLETFQRLSQHSSQLPIIVLSAESDGVVAEAAVSQGAQDYLVKGAFDHHTLCRAIRFAMERSKRLRIQQEISGAEVVQQTLYPKANPVVAGFDIAGRAYPAENMSGDYFDFIPMPDDSIGLAIGDVSGHGLGPALKMAETRAYLRVLAGNVGEGTPQVSKSPGEILTAANRLLYSDDCSLLLTLFFAHLDAETRTLVYAAGGHRAYFLPGDSDEVQVLLETGSVLACFADATIDDSGPMTLNPNDIVFICTDGIEESFSTEREMFGGARTAEMLLSNRDKPAIRILEEIVDAARNYTGRAKQQDDITAIVVKCV